MKFCVEKLLLEVSFWIAQTKFTSYDVFPLFQDEGQEEGANANQRVLDALPEGHDQRPVQVKRLYFASILVSDGRPCLGLSSISGFGHKLRQASLRIQFELASAGYTVRRTCMINNQSYSNDSNSRVLDALSEEHDQQPIEVK